MGNHRVEHLTFHIHSVLVQHLVVILDVLSYLDDFFVFVERFEYVYKS